MNKLILALILFASLAACVPRQPIDFDIACRDRFVTLNHAQSSISAAPGYVAMCGGRTLTINVVPPVAARATRSRQAAEGNPQAAPWLDRESDDGRTITISLPDSGLRVGETYKYVLEVDGVGVLDPTIGIIRQ